MKKILIILALVLSVSGEAFSQDSLMNLFDTAPQTIYTQASFKTTRIVLGQSVASPAKGNLLFVIQHHFGYVNQGPYQFFGLDQATIRLGFEYGLTDWLQIGVGRSSYEKTYDGSVKLKILRQSTGKRKMPVSLSYFGSIGINTLHPNVLSFNYYFSNRLTFLNQVLIARKFSPAITIQITPSFVHRNLVATPTINNNVYALGAGGRFKISNHSTFNVEYFYVIPQAQTTTKYRNSLSLGFNIETGGHVFQLYVSNSQGIIGQNFIPGTTGNWLKGDVVFGFNITRTFVIKKPKQFKKSSVFLPR